MKRNIILTVILVGLACLLISAEALKSMVAKSNPPVPKAQVERLTGDWEGARLSRDVRILWLYGPEDHRGGEHDYIRIKELCVPLLKEIPRVSVDEAYQFPSQKQFEEADLLIQYLHLPDLSDEQFAMYQAFVDRGGAVVSLHESCIMRPLDHAEKLAGCIGCSWKGNKDSKWGRFDHQHKLFLDTTHPAFEGLPSTMKFNDESYWNLLTRDNVQVIGAIAPDTAREDQSFKEALVGDEARSQAFWTYTSGKGRVFGTTTGHFTYTFYDPMYRLLLMRGVAWSLDEKPGPFMPLVFAGITGEKDMVGTTDTMFDYKNRKR
jgi:type 1 glutamine amidotransferase